MKLKYPQDSEEFKKERKSFQILFYKLNTDVWQSNGSDNFDHGVDYSFEYIEDDEYKGYRILSQIKSTEHIIDQGENVAFDLNVKTASYSIGSSQPFILFLIDLITDTVYYVCLQELFVSNNKLYEKLKKNATSIRVKIPKQNIVNRDAIALQEIAKRQYSFSENRGVVQVR
jgi:hypothetical protein